MSSSINRIFDYHGEPEGNNNGNNEDINIVMLVKQPSDGPEERYCFTYIESEKSQILKQLGRFAMNEELSFTWRDAATLSSRIRGQCGSDPGSDPGSEQGFDL